MNRIAFLLMAMAATLLPLSSSGQVNDALANALVNGSPWRFTNKHVNLIQTWRYSPDGKLEHMSSHAPSIWLVEEITADQRIVHPSTAGGNTVTYYLDKDGKAKALHSKNPSDFISIKAEQK